MDNPVNTIKDKQGRDITIGGEGNNIVAEHNNLEIGRFDFDIMDDGFQCFQLLTNCHVNVTYQQNGIGTEMMKLAEEWYDNFCIVDHFSTQGEAFMNHCRKNVFQKSHKIINDARY
ncbi:MAG: GNAT family N-acetyltransferase [Flavobacteriales bacterium]|nr:GNAT family N-acetyltransferase [Flavobacteriales bacterium]